MPELPAAAKWPAYRVSSFSEHFSSVRIAKYSAMLAAALAELARGINVLCDQIVHGGHIGAATAPSANIGSPSLSLPQATFPEAAASAAIQVDAVLFPA